MMTKKGNILLKKILSPVLFWVGLIVYVVLVPPETMLSFIGFYILLFFCCLTVLKKFFKAQLAILLTFYCLILLFLFHVKLANQLDTALLTALFTTIFFYFRK